MKLEITLNKEQFDELRTALASLLASSSGIVLNTARMADAWKPKEEHVAAEIMPETQRKPRKKGRSWTRTEVALLTKCKYNGLNGEEIRQKFIDAGYGDRTTEAFHSKWHDMTKRKN